jgi:hypothetical protein
MKERSGVFVATRVPRLSSNVIDDLQSARTTMSEISLCK